MHALQTEEVSAHNISLHDYITTSVSMLCPIDVSLSEQFTVRSAVLSSPKVLRHATTNAGRSMVAALLPRYPPSAQLIHLLAAQMLGDPKLGKIAEGCYADILVLNVNPLEDVVVLDYPEKHLFAVIQDGRVVSSCLDDLPAQGIPA